MTVQIETPRAPNILRAPQVAARIGVSRATVWRWIKAGEFPAAIPLGAQSVGWLDTEVDAWIQSRATARTAGGEA